MPPPRLDRAGKYRILERLGDGGMGEVWKAWDPELGRWAALKFLKGGDPKEAARFRREAQIAAGLVHPNIAAVYDVGEADGRPFLAMQLVEGRTLRSWSRRDPREIVPPVRDAARAADHAHRQGIVHRDLKPENIMVGDRVYVMDFGLARQVEGGADLSRSGSIVGTPTYMAPEQTRAEPLDGRADVWALGVTLYHLLTGRRPFEGRATYSLLLSIQRDDPAPPRRHSPRIDADLEAVILRCLEKEPSRRYASAADLADDLDRWLAGEPVRAVRPSVGRRALRWIRRHRAATAAAAAGVLAVAAVGAVTLPGWRAASESARMEARRREEAELYLPIEKELDILRMKMYRPEFRLTADELAEYERLEARIRARMEEAGATPIGWYLIGRCRDLREDPDAALAAYDRALELDGHHVAALLESGRLLLRRGIDIRTVRQHLLEFEADAAEALAAGRDRIRRAAGAERSMAGDLAEATRRVVEGGPGDALKAEPFLAAWGREPFVEEFLVLEALDAHLDGRPKAVEAPAEEAVRRAPSWPRALLARSLKWGPGEEARAESDLTRVLEIHPRLAEAWRRRGSLRAECRRDREALEDFDQAIRLRPKEAAYVGDRGYARLQAGDPAGALRDFDEMARLAPGALAPRVLRLRALALLSRYEEAIREAGLLLREWPDHAHVLALRGSIRSTSGDAEGGLADLDRAIALDPRQALAYSARATARWNLGRFDEALEDANRSISLDPTFPEAWNVRGNAKSRKGDIAGAIADYEECLKRKPGYPEALYNLGGALQAAGRFEEAMGRLDEAIFRRPTYERALVRRGHLKRFMADIAGARADFRRAVELGPGRGANWLGLAELEVRQGEPRDAWAALERARDLGADGRTVTFLIGLYRYRTGDRVDAAAQFRAALVGAGPEWPYRAEAEAALKVIQNER